MIYPYYSYATLELQRRFDDNGNPIGSSSSPSKSQRQKKGNTCADGNVIACFSEIGNSIATGFDNAGKFITGGAKSTTESLNKVGENTGKAADNAGKFATDASRNASEQVSKAGQSFFQFGGLLPFALIGAGAIVLIMLLRRR